MAGASDIRKAAQQIAQENRAVIDDLPVAAQSIAKTLIYETVSDADLYRDKPVSFLTGKMHRRKYSEQMNMMNVDEMLLDAYAIDLIDLGMAPEVARKITETAILTGRTLNETILRLPKSR